MTYPELARQLVALREADLAFRDRLIEAGELGNGYHPEMAELHRRHAKALGAIIEEIGGYPTVDKVGEAGSAAAWLIVQHAIGQPTFMRSCARLLEDAVARREAHPVSLAYLTDRIATFEGRPQRFGTQFDWDEDGRMSPLPVDDPAGVDQRRAALGLCSLEEQTGRMREQAAREQEGPPADHRQRKEEMDAWRRSVGWIP